METVVIAGRTRRLEVGRVGGLTRRSAGPLPWMVTTLLAAWFTTPLAHAQPPSPVSAEAQLEAARAAYLEARFGEARDQLRSMLEGSETGLTHSKIVDALALEAMVHFAMRDEPSTRTSLRQLAVLAPHHQWSEEAPPPIRDQWAVERTQVQEPRVEAHATRRDSQVRIEATVHGELSRLVNRWEVRARLVGTEAWETASSPLLLEFDNPHAAIYEVQVRALGPGGIEVRNLPHRLQVVSNGVLGADEDVAGGSRRRQRWILAVASVVLFSAVVAGVAIRVSRIERQPSTELQGPFFE